MINPHQRIRELEATIMSITIEKRRAIKQSRYSRAKHLQRRRRVYIREKRAILYTLEYEGSQVKKGSLTRSAEFLGGRGF